MNESTFSYIKCGELAWFVLDTGGETQLDLPSVCVYVCVFRGDIATATFLLQLPTLAKVLFSLCMLSFCCFCGFLLVNSRIAVVPVQGGYNNDSVLRVSKPVVFCGDSVRNASFSHRTVLSATTSVLVLVNKQQVHQE